MAESQEGSDSMIKRLLVILGMIGLVALLGCSASDPLVDDFYITDVYGRKKIQRQ